MSSSPACPDREQVAAELRRVADLFASSELSADQAEQLVAQVARLGDELEAAGHDERGPWWHRGPDYTEAFDADSPFRGRENPWGPSMSLCRVGPDGGVGAGATGQLVADRSCAGPPNTLHGGVLAGLFDEVIGEAAAHAAPDVFAVTGRLNVRYRKPTPIGVELALAANVVSLSSRSMRLEATCQANGETTATATALMVVRGQRRQTT